MKKLIRLPGFIILLLLPGISPAQDYEIRLSHRAKAGEKYRLSAKASHVEVMTIFSAGKLLGHRGNDMSVDLVSLGSVIQTGDDGRVTKYALEIERCLVTTGGASKPLIPPGETLVATLEGRRYDFTINDRPVDSVTAAALALVLTAQTPGIRDDDVFGTRERKKVGESWPINGNLAAQAIRESFKVETPEGGVKGFTTLEGVVRGGENDYLIIGASLSVDEFSIPLPDGIRIHSGHLVASFSGRFPVAPDLPPLAQSISLIGKFSATRPADEKTQEITLEGTIARKIERQLERAR